MYGTIFGKSDTISGKYFSIWGNIDHILRYWGWTNGNNILAWGKILGRNGRNFSRFGLGLAVKNMVEKKKVMFLQFQANGGSDLFHVGQNLAYGKWI